MYKEIKKINMLTKNKIQKENKNKNNVNLFNKIILK